MLVLEIAAGTFLGVTLQMIMFTGYVKLQARRTSGTRQAQFQALQDAIARVQQEDGSDGARA